MSDEGRINTALALYNHLARQDEAERVTRFYRERDKRRAPSPGGAKPIAQPMSSAKPTVPAHLAAERARALAIIAAAPAGAETERDEAIRSGASVETFLGWLAGRAILNARRKVGG